MCISSIFGLVLLYYLSSYKVSGQELDTLVYDLRDGPQLFKKYIKKFGKTFNGQEDYYNRYDQFMKTLKTINQINSKPGSRKVRLNQHADLTDDQKRFINVEKTTKIDPELKLLMQKKRPRVDSLFQFIY